MMHVLELSCESNMLLQRLLPFAGLCGLLAHGPLSHFWYLFCDGVIAELPVRHAALRSPMLCHAVLCCAMLLMHSSPLTVAVSE